MKRYKSKNKRSKKFGARVILLLAFMILLLLSLFFVGAKKQSIKANENSNESSLGAKTLEIFGRLKNRKNAYYVDCNNGSDDNNGTSMASAWKSLTKASAAALGPGKSLLLKRGCVWTEPFSVTGNGSSRSNILIDAYGEGVMPIIQNSTSPNTVTIGGSYITIQNIYAQVAATNFAAGCSNNPIGELHGFSFEPGSAYNTLQNSKVTGAYAGVFIKSDSHHNKILQNEFIDNNMMAQADSLPDNDYGAFSVLLWGDDNEISHNTMTGSDACSYDYIRDGSAVEVYGGQRNLIRYNKAYNNDAFAELGNSRSSDNTFAYNLFVSNLPRSIFLVTRGPSTYGPVLRTKVINNTAYLTGSTSQGFVCVACSTGEILTLINNTLWSSWVVGRVEGNISENNNIFWGGSIYFSKSPTSQFIDPQFIEPGIDFRLKSSSPAINKGVLTGITEDIDGNKVPQGIGTDIGAYEHVF